ncbi:transglycosylase domain-containing protein [Gandjariella thermophila]|uniref:Penicillin-binding protein n=1 Tax=Gandjariella thermophila TaxID=1931992 RepID=A0A4D4J7R8_9PSEU|nr:transglycosylase domain-containing protein [Gandjariella thermophila]GDY30708.1 penicillin-binding protein [Gandjariella thermophila]
MRHTDGVLKLLGLCGLAGVLVAGVLFPAVGAAGMVSNRASDTVDATSTDLAGTDPPLMTTITDRDGVPIAYLYEQYRVLTPPDKIAPAMKAAIVAVEDRRFYEHQGVDWRGTVRAMLTNEMRGTVTQGASTLTQQYVKNYLVSVVARNNKEEQQRAQEQTVARKLREARIALQLEHRLSKDEILARYLNIVPFGANIYGVGAAAQAYFGTTPEKLSVAQAALLAGMVNSPIALNPLNYPERALERRNVVIDKMVESGSLDPGLAAEARREPLGIVNPMHVPSSNCIGAGPAFGFFCAYVVDYLERSGFTAQQLRTGGYTIRTTLDRNASLVAKQAAEAHVPKTTDGIANTMAIVQPGRDRHRVVALVANRDYGLDQDAGQTTLDLPSGVQNMFGAGSIYKIFTAAAALDRGMGIFNRIDVPQVYVSHRYVTGGRADCPRTGHYDDRWYCVTNASNGYPSSMTMQQALASSPNTGFVSLVDQIGMEPVLDMARRLGLRDSLQTNELGQPPRAGAERQEISQPQIEYFRDKPSFTLGPSPVSTLELANVAATLMSGGRWCPPTPIEAVLDAEGRPVPVNEAPCEAAVPEPLANTLVEGLSRDDDPAMAGTSAAAAAAAHWKRPLMAKTGTTQTNYSAGFVGAVPQYAGAVLTFNDGPRPRTICATTPPRLAVDCKGIFGGTVPAPTWYDAMTKILAGQPVLPLPPGDPRYEHGGDETQIPNVVGEDVEDATNRLHQAGYDVVTRARNSAAPGGTVVAQSPRGNALPGTTVTLFVSTGYLPVPQTTAAPPPPPPPVVVPGPGPGIPPPGPFGWWPGRGR